MCDDIEIESRLRLIIIDKNQVNYQMKSYFYFFNQLTKSMSSHIVNESND